MNTSSTPINTTFPFKVCCIQSTDEADAAIAAGASAIGLVGKMPNGPGPIDDDLIESIATYVKRRHKNRVWTTLLTSRTNGADIAAHVDSTNVNTVQIVDTPEDDAISILRRAHPKLRIIQVVHVENEDAIGIARAAAELADVILLDSGKPSAQKRTLGGTGDTHDWTVSRRIVELIDKPAFLAGGLNPVNVAEAIAQVRPYGVDVCSGLRIRERGYTLSPEKLQAFAAHLVNNEAETKIAATL